MQVKVSIIVPVYNVEKYISKCIDSLIGQTLQEIEIIIVDDKSPDNCPAICDEYAMTDKRIKVIHKENEGAGMARNTGLEFASGEYVAFLDADDYVDNNMYRTLYEESLTYDLDACFCDIINFDDNGAKKPYLRQSEIVEIDGLDECKSFSLDLLSPPLESSKTILYPNASWNAIYKRSILTESQVKFVSEREFVSEDVLFHLENMPMFQRIKWIEKPLIYHLVSNPSSLTNTLRFSKIKSSLNMLSRVKMIIGNSYSNSGLNSIYYAYSYKLISDISYAIVHFSSGLQKIKFLFYFLRNSYAIVAPSPDFYSMLHESKQSKLLFLFSKGKILEATLSYLFDVIFAFVKAKIK